MKSYKVDRKNSYNFAHIKEYMLKFSKIVVLIAGIVVAVLCMTILL